MWLTSIGWMALSESCWRKKHSFLRFVHAEFESSCIYPFCKTASLGSIIDQVITMIHTINDQPGRSKISFLPREPLQSFPTVPFSHTTVSKPAQRATIGNSGQPQTPDFRLSRSKEQFFVALLFPMCCCFLAKRRVCCSFRGRERERERERRRESHE